MHNLLLTINTASNFSFLGIVLAVAAAIFFWASNAAFKKARTARPAYHRVLGACVTILAMLCLCGMLGSFAMSYILYHLPD